jgi:glycyl-tRNA synthetase beta chain
MPTATLPPRSSEPPTARPRHCSTTAWSPARRWPIGLQKALDEAIAKLPIPKVMSYQLETDCELPGWSSVNFVRPAHSLVALHGTTVVPVKALGLSAGRTTQGHRFEAAVSPVVIANADSYADTLARDGAVIASFAAAPRRDRTPAGRGGQQVGGGCRPIEDDACSTR